MHPIDGIVLGLLLWGAYSGFKQGLVRELVASLLLFFSCTKGISLFHFLLPMAEHKWPNFDAYVPVALALVLFLVGGCLLVLVTKLVHKLIRVSFLGIFDAVLGACIGVGKVACCISFLLYVCPYTGLAFLSHTDLADSVLLTPIKPLFPTLVEFVFGLVCTPDISTVALKGKKGSKPV